MKHDDLLSNLKQRNIRLVKPHICKVNGRWEIIFEHPYIKRDITNDEYKTLMFVDKLRD